MPTNRPLKVVRGGGGDHHPDDEPKEKPKGDPTGTYRFGGGEIIVRRLGSRPQGK